MKLYGRAAIGGVFWSWLGSAVMELMWLPAVIITARLLTPEDFGVVTAATFFVSLATRLTQFGFNQALVRMKHIDEDHASSVFVMNIALGIVAWLALAFSAPAIGRFFRSPATGQILPIAALSFLVTPIGTVPSALLARDLRYRQITYVAWINSVTSATSTVLLAWVGFGYWSLVYGQLAAAATSSLAKMVYARWLPRFRFRLSAARDALSFGVAIYALRLVEYGALNFDSMAVGKTMGMTALGFYDKAFNLMSRLLDRLNQAGPAISFRVFSIIQDEQDRFRRGYRKVVLSSTLLAYPFLIALAFTASPLFEVLFGGPWVTAARPFQILCVAGALKVLNAYAASVVEATGHVWSAVWRQGVYASLVVVGVVALSPWGISGAATAMLLATVVVTVLMHQLLCKATALRWTDIVEPQVPALICSGGLIACLTTARYFVAQVTSVAWIVLPVLMVTGALFYVAFLFLVPVRAVRELVDDVTEHLWSVVRGVLPQNKSQSPMTPLQ